MQIGGLGSLSGDIGGGYDIVLFVYRAIYEQLFLGKEATSLREAYFTLLDIHTREAFLHSAARLREESIAHSLCALFFVSVDTGDAVSLAYAAECAACAADRIVAASRKGGGSKDEGSILGKAALGNLFGGDN